MQANGTIYCIRALSSVPAAPWFRQCMLKKLKMPGTLKLKVAKVSVKKTKKKVAKAMPRSNSVVVRCDAPCMR
jgi:hypothetical protein